MLIFLKEIILYMKGSYITKDKNVKEGEIHHADFKAKKKLSENYTYQ